MTARITATVEPRREILTRKILPGALVVVRIGEHEFEAECGDSVQAEQVRESTTALVEVATCDRVHVITRGDKIAAVFAGPAAEDAARELALIALNDPSAPLAIRTMAVETESSCSADVGAADAAGPRVETQDQAIERMRIQTLALVEQWVAGRTVPTHHDAAQVLVGLGLSWLCAGGTPLEVVMQSVANVWHHAGGKS